MTGSKVALDVNLALTVSCSEATDAPGFEGFQSLKTPDLSRKLDVASHIPRVQHFFR